MVADQTGKVCLPPNLYFILVVGFEISVTRLMKADQNCHNLAQTQTTMPTAVNYALSFLQPITQQLALPLWFKGLTEVIDRTE